jgi:hypothetical protein
MPLVNRPSLTPKKLAANRANAQLSRGPITLEGLIRLRDSKMKHGAYAQNREEALRALGEDPKDFEALLESLKASRVATTLPSMSLPPRRPELN